jgi:hypothetical protein
VPPLVSFLLRDDNPQLQARDCCGRYPCRPRGPAALRLDLPFAVRGRLVADQHLLWIQRADQARTLARARTSERDGRAQGRDQCRRAEPVRAPARQPRPECRGAGALRCSCIRGSSQGMTPAGPRRSCGRWATFRATRLSSVTWCWRSARWKRLSVSAAARLASAVSTPTEADCGAVQPFMLARTCRSRSCGTLRGPCPTSAAASRSRTSSGCAHSPQPLRHPPQAHIRRTAGLFGHPRAGEPPDKLERRRDSHGSLRRLTRVPRWRPTRRAGCGLGAILPVGWRR